MSCSPRTLPPLPRERECNKKMKMIISDSRVKNKRRIRCIGGFRSAETLSATPSSLLAVHVVVPSRKRKQQRFSLVVFPMSTTTMLLSLLLLLNQTEAWVSSTSSSLSFQRGRKPDRRTSAITSSSSALHLAPITLVMTPTMASIVAGSIAGAIGVGVAFPLDTVKTQQQVMQQQHQSNQRKSSIGQEVTSSSDNKRDYNQPTTNLAVSDEFSATSFNQEGRDHDRTDELGSTPAAAAAAFTTSSESPNLVAVDALLLRTYKQQQHQSNIVVASGGAAALRATTVLPLSPLLGVGMRKHEQEHEPQQSCFQRIKRMIPSSASAKRSDYAPRNQPPLADITAGGSAAVAATIAVEATEAMAVSSSNKPTMNMWDVAQQIMTTQGVPGLFRGVQTSMLGQAVIKSVAFSVNAGMLAWLQQAQPYDTAAAAASYHPEQLVIAAATAGFVTAFLAAPCDRVKVLMQCNSGGASGDNTNSRCTIDCNSEWDCLQGILRTEGWRGLLTTGLGPTILREVPAYTVYFSTYGLLLQYYHQVEWLSSSTFSLLPPSLVCGAVAGALCVVPSYPADVVKTMVQNTQVSSSSSCNNNRDSKKTGAAMSANTTWQVVRDLYQQSGMGAFWEGLTPRMLRASVNHAVTFVVFDAIVQYLQQQAV